MKRHRIAVIPGDGIGKEVMPEGIRVLEAAGRRFDISFVLREGPRTRDVGGRAGTREVGEAIASAV